MARAVRLSNDQRRARLLSVGRTLFSQKPYDTVSMDAIGRRARISKGLVYHYFPSKRAFYTATIEDAVDEFVAAITPEPGLEFGPALLGSLGRFIDFIESNGALFKALVRGGIGSDAQVSAIVERGRTEAVERVRELMGLASLSPRLGAMLYGWIGATEAMALRWIDRRDVARDELQGLIVAALRPVLAEVAAGVPGRNTGAS
jgi:AcrR family transcriptional regulator